MGKDAGQAPAFPHQPSYLSSRLLRLAPLAAAAMLLAGECRADWRVQPTFNLSETFTDNVSLQSDAFRQSQFVTELTPGIVLSGKGRRFQVAGAAQARQFIYSKGDLPNTADHSVEYSFAGNGEMIEDMLFLEASASASRQPVSAFGQQGGASLYSLGNQTTIKTWRIAPRFEQRLGRAAALSLRYSRDAVQADRFASGYGDSLGSTISASLASTDRSSKLGWGLSYQSQDLDSKIGGASSTESALGNLRYALLPRFALTASVGYDRYEFDSLGNGNAGSNWSGGIDWTPSPRTRLSASLGRHYYGQTGKLDLTHRSRYTVWRVSYDDTVTNSREQFLLPSTIDTAAMLDSLFAATISDPVQRRQAVAAYIQQTGLPPSLADNINFLSNRFFREKRLQASSAFQRGRSSVLVTLFANDRVALSDQQTDSPLLGSQFSALNNNVRQKGISATYNYRLTARSSAIAAVNFAHNRSITTGVEDHPRQLRLGLTRELGSDLRAAFEYRHQSGQIDRIAGGYRENAISASLSAQF